MNETSVEQIAILARNARRAVMTQVGRLKAQRLLAGVSRPYKLHLGCGQVHFDGWVNVDARRLAGVDMVWDLTYGVPSVDRACSFIYTEHMLEHLRVEEGLSFLRECRRALHDDGVLRIAMPSLDFILGRAVSSDWRDQEWLRRPAYASVKTRAEMLNVAFRSWGHQYLYDREELHRRLHEAGFSRITDVERGESSHLELRNRETRPDSLLVCEAQR